MNIAEILRKIADAVDQHETPAAQPVHIKAVAAVPTDDSVDSSNDDLTPVPTDVMLPPLQGKYELLKRAVGVQNKFNQGDTDDDPEASNHKVTPMESDEQSALDRMKKNAGISAFITHELADDEPFES
jgi:hypothetical protein